MSNDVEVLGSLRELRNSDDAHGLLGVLEMCVRSNFAGIESQRLYSEVWSFDQRRQSG